MQPSMSRTKHELGEIPWLTYCCRIMEERINDTYETASKLVPTYEEQIGHTDIERLNPGAKLAENEKFQRDKQSLEKTKRRLAELEGAISMLPETEEKIIRARYCESRPKSWIEISLEVSFSVRQCQNIHGEALAKLDLALHGVREVV